MLHGTVTFYQIVGNFFSSHGRIRKVILPFSERFDSMAINVEMMSPTSENLHFFSKDSWQMEMYFLPYLLSICSCLLYEWICLFPEIS